MHRPMIAVVNNDPALLASISTVLSAAGLRVITHQGFTGAAEVLLSECPDLVILDLQLGMLGAGLEVLNQLHHAGIQARSSVIMASADIAELRHLAPILRTNGYETLEKPFTEEALRAKIRQVLDRRTR